MTYQYPADRKPHVRRATLFGHSCWEAGCPGGVYLFGEGLHFYTWLDAIRYATSGPTP
jgi:hypothetical protein